MRCGELDFMNRFLANVARQILFSIREKLAQYLHQEVLLILKMYTFVTCDSATVS